MTAWLLTWLWQGVALAGGVAVALRCVPRLNAATKHLIWCGVLVVLAWLGWASSPYRGLTPVQVSGPVPIYIPSAPDLLISIVIGIWTALALVKLLRLVPSLHAVYALRDRCRPFPPHVETQLPLWLEAKAQGRRTQLMVCDEVAGATVLGFQHPCIAIPSALADALTVDELDLVILHEHAHVQRRDDWARLAQTLLLSVLSIHPAALLVSRAVNRECEMACDEWVVARTGLPKAYARCLAHAAEVRGRARSGLQLVPAFLGGRHDLVRRVERLLAIKNARRNVSFGGAAAAALAILLLSAQLQSVRALAEIAEIVLPQVQRVQGVRWVQELQEVRWVQEVREVQRVQVPRAATRVASAPVAPTPIAPIAPVAPLAPVAPVALMSTARIFTGAYLLPDAQVEARAAQSNPWRVLAAPGLEIASAAKKTSAGIASVFSRAGVSLARSF